jgi:tetrahydromethanopterin S-methyltransferase subunit H
MESNNLPKISKQDVIDIMSEQVKKGVDQIMEECGIDEDLVDVLIQFGQIANFMPSESTFLASFTMGVEIGQKRAKGELISQD